MVEATTTDQNNFLLELYEDLSKTFALDGEEKFQGESK